MHQYYCMHIKSHGLNFVVWQKERFVSVLNFVGEIFRGLTASKFLGTGVLVIAYLTL